MPFLSKLVEVCQKSYETHTFELGDVECLYARLGGRHVYAIRGTEPKIITDRGIIDVIRDLWFWHPKREEYHYGFWEGWNRISEPLLNHYYKKLLTNPGSLCLTGHSMGGSIALIGASKLLSDGFDPKGLACVTFGAPKCIDTDEAFSLEQESILKECAMEVIHPKDPIPSAFNFAGFEYTGEPMYLHPYKKAKWYKRRLKYHNLDEYGKELRRRGF